MAIKEWGMNNGFVKVAAAVPELKVADCVYNADCIIELINKANENGVQFMVFPELCITSYTCGDLFHQQLLLDEAEKQLGKILEKTKTIDVVAMVGMPVYAGNRLFDCSAVIQGGKIIGVVPKAFIPGHEEFCEERWFASGYNSLDDTVMLCGCQVPFGIDLLFEAENEKDVCFGIEVSEDLWAPIPPSSYQALAGAVLLFNLSASNDIIGKAGYRRNLVMQQSGRCISGYIYTSSGVHESTTDLVFGGHAIIAENGKILSESKRFSREAQMICTEIDIERLINDRLVNTSFMKVLPQRSFRKVAYNLRKVYWPELSRHIDPYPFVPSDMAEREERCSEIFAIQTAGLAKRLVHTASKRAVIGVSGGLDSTLALLVTARTFDMLGISRKNIITVTMPGFGTSEETYANALRLMRSMGTTIREIDIKEACLVHFGDIGHSRDDRDVTYENVQARERTQILMDIANKVRGLVVGTGDLSELALGWCTYNGDHMSMYAVNCSIPKTLVKHLVKWAADNISDQEARDVLCRILNTPITPELLPPSLNGEIKQRTEDIIGPYELHDFFLYHMARYGTVPKKILFLASQAFKGIYSEGEIKGWLKVFYKRFFSQQFKRSCIPDGPKVGTVSLSPRGGWRMPSDAEARIWLAEIDA